MRGGGDAHPTIRVPVADLAPGETRLASFDRDGQRLTAIVVNHQGELLAYVNRCPHVTYSLDIGDGRVQDSSGQYLMCASHGAMFQPETGECFMGPVVGRRLESLPAEVDGLDLVVTITPEPEGWPRT